MKQDDLGRAKNCAVPTHTLGGDKIKVNDNIL